MQTNMNATSALESVETETAVRPRITYLTQIEQVKQLMPEEQSNLKKVTSEFAFRSNSYYQNLIDWNDPADPIRRLIIPQEGELVEWGQLDASHEASYMVAPGVEHKYRSTALMLVTDVCGGYCRYCFRKRLFMPDNNETLKDVSKGVTYIRDHPEITNVLLTGGDPLILSTHRLAAIMRQVAEIDHIEVIRIGSKMPAFNPLRIVNDGSLLQMLREISRDASVYVITHFNHPRELTPEAVQALNALRLAGVTTANQTPLIRGVNDDSGVLAKLFVELSRIGTPPYYVFQCRPTIGNLPYSVPLEEAYDTFVRAQEHCSGLAKRARFIMSHETGKVEIVGRASGFVYMRYHQSVDPANTNRLLIFRSNPAARWLNDYDEAATLNVPSSNNNCSSTH